MSFLGSLTWRRAEKDFTPVSATAPLPDIEPILQAACAAPSAFGLQPWKLFVITDPATKALLAPLAYGQPQITSCSHLLVFCARKDLDERVLDYAERTCVPDEYVRMMTETLSGLSHPTHWAKHQTYLALGFALAAAAEARIASCPMEGFSAEGFSHVLDLPHTLVPTALMAVGIHKADATPHPRFRFPREDLVESLQATVADVRPVAVRSKYRNVTPRRRRHGDDDGKN
jgi:nitroreductase/dihydropteridine reductase